MSGEWLPRMARRCGLAVTAMVVIGVAMLIEARGHERPAAIDQPIQKIILMSIDALRADRLGCYGYQEAETSPTIDAWARRALLFERAFSQAPWTVPSLASLMSGRYPAEVGAHTNLHGDIVMRTDTLAERLHRLGYRTAFFNTNPVLWRPGIRRGFDAAAPAPLGRKIPYTSVEPLVMKWLDEHAREKFFLWIHDMDTHMPPTEGNPYLGTAGWQPYDAEVRWVDEAVRRLFAKLDTLGIRDEVLIIFTADHGEAFGEHKLYGHDSVIYDEVLHIPLIVQYPGMVRKGRVPTPVALLDVHATITELAGAAVRATDRGESLVPRTAIETTHVRDRQVFSSRYYFTDDIVDSASGAVLAAASTHHLALHAGRWALVAKVPVSGSIGHAGEGEVDDRALPDWTTTSTGASYELYDLATDPLEQHDASAAQPTVLADLRQALGEWKQLIASGERPNEAAKGASTTVDQATRDAMHALGYTVSR